MPLRPNTWHTSSKSTNGSNCVEVMETEEGEFLVRDTKDGGAGPVHRFTRAEWDAFLAGAAEGEFDPSN